MTRDAALRACAFAAAAALTLACSGAPRGAVAESAVWAEAEARWVEHRDPLAFRAWRALPSTSSGGREARDRLARADRLYRLGIARVRSGDSSALSDVLACCALCTDTGSQVDVSEIGASDG